MTAPSDPTRWNELFDRHYNAIVADLVRQFRIQPDDARDVAQETFLNVYMSMDQYRGESEWVYLKSAAYNVARNRLRHGKAQMRDERLNTAIDDAVHHDGRKPSIEQQLVQREQTALFIARYREAKMHVPPLTRACFLLRLHGKSYDEIAADTQLTIEAVRSRLRDARKRLREEVGEARPGIDWPEVAEEDDDEHES